MWSSNYNMQAYGGGTGYGWIHNNTKGTGAAGIFLQDHGDSANGSYESWLSWGSLFIIYSITLMVASLQLVDAIMAVNLETVFKPECLHFV